jgi:PAS domain S-box-containing protein
MYTWGNSQDLTMASVTQEHAALMQKKKVELADEVTRLRQQLGELKPAEKTLHDSEELFRNAFETSAAGMALHDIAGNYLRVNQTWCTLLGYTEQELLQMNWRNITHPDDIDSTEALDEDTELGKRNNFTIEKRYIHKEGNIVWARVCSAHLRDSEGVLQFILGQIYDITDIKKLEDALRQSRDLFSRTFQSNPNLIALVDPATGQHFDVNETWLTRLKFTRKEVIGKTSFEFNHWVDIRDRDLILKEHSERGRVRNFIGQLRAKDGTLIDCSFSTEPIKMEHMELVLWTIIDITERKRIEEDVAEKEALLRVVLDSVPAGIRCFDKDDNYLFFNARYSELWDLPDDLLKIGDPLRVENLYIAERGDFGEGDLDELVENVQHALPFNLEPQHYGRTTLAGRILDCHTQPTGLGGHVSIHIDITDLKQMEESLRENEERYRQAAQIAKLGHWVWDTIEDRCISCSRELARIHGTTVEEFLALSDSTEKDAAWPHSDDQEQFEHAMREAHEHHKGFDIEYRIIARDGVVRHVHEIGQPIFDRNGVHVMTQGITQDITANKLAEQKLNETMNNLTSEIFERQLAETEVKKQRDELEKLNAQKDKFFSIIAHDLKSPFTALLGYSSLLSSGVAGFDQDKVIEYSGAVHESGQRLFRLLENLLEWARLQMGQLEFEPAPVDLKEIIDANLDLFAPNAGEKEISLTSTRRQPLIVFADAHMVETIVRNLINNAIKFTPKMGSVTISARRIGKWAEIKVTDTGIGMSVHKTARLFCSNEVASTAGTGGESGTGLGLQLCSELVDKQGGHIRVESSKGNGSAFLVKLPLHRI